MLIKINYQENSGAFSQNKFTFDRVFDLNTTQKEIYEVAAKPIIESKSFTSKKIQVFWMALMEQYSHMDKLHLVRRILCRVQISKIWKCKVSYLEW